MRVAITLVLVCGTAAADTHVIQRGETVAHVAEARGCTVDAVLRANNLTTTLVPAGTKLTVPACSLRKRAQARTRVTDEDKALAALAAIDEDHLSDHATRLRTPVGPPGRRADSAPTSLGEPWDGKLRDAVQLVEEEGFSVRRPARAWGAPHVVERVRGAIGEVRALYPELHTLAIGDLSLEHGGKIADHSSHQSGLDVDIGFYFKRVPEDYPAHFAEGDNSLDLEATWALITAFARTADLPDGVQVIFLDRAVQARLYRWAKKHGTPLEELEALFEYPRDGDAHAGVIRHWPNHADHFHVRFKSGR